MDLFLETPQQQAERMLRQQQFRLMEMQMQGVVAQPPAQNATPAICLRARLTPRTIPYNKIRMHRSLRLTSATRVTVAWASACAR